MALRHTHRVCTSVSEALGRTRCLNVVVRHYASEFNFEEYGMYPAPLKQMDAKAGKQMIATLEDHDDKYTTRVMYRGPWDTTKDPEFPNLVTSDYNTRLIGCSCDVYTTEIHYMRLEKGKPRQCPCGFWYRLVDDDPEYRMLTNLPNLQQYEEMIEGYKKKHAGRWFKEEPGAAPEGQIPGGTAADRAIRDTK